MKFAHLSDLHYTLKDKGDSPLREGLKGIILEVLDDVSSIQNELSFITITGDLAENGDLASYLELRELFRRFNVPVLLVPGNHDKRQEFSDVFACSYRCPVDNKIDYRVIFNSTQFVGLDTLIEGETIGALCSSQLSYLKDCLSDPYFSHTVVSMHHPPFVIGHSEFDPMSQLLGSNELGEIVSNSRSKVIILCGHVHRPYQAFWQGATCFIAGSPSFQMGSGFCFGREPLLPVDEPYAYFIHSIDAMGEHVIGTRYVELSTVSSNGFKGNGCI